jgi:hypothetical protein
MGFNSAFKGLIYKQALVEQLTHFLTNACQEWFDTDPF